VPGAGANAVENAQAVLVRHRLYCYRGIRTNRILEGKGDTDGVANCKLLGRKLQRSEGYLQDHAYTFT
jgi:hypothetical protein